MYAVGTYFDPLAMSMVKSQGEKELKTALLDPTYPRVSFFFYAHMTFGQGRQKYADGILSLTQLHSKQRPFA